MDKYIVWVGGTVDAEGVSKEKAEEIAKQWKDQGYDDVIIEEV
tara:strand:+ start:403 stop:531 length:129 start_codon:yes stop_codon:yes gene_type:complete